MEKLFGSSALTASPPSLRREGPSFYFMPLKKPAITSVMSWKLELPRYGF
jgi:hypothetical protein